MNDRRIALAAAAVAFVLHAVANPHYGYFRDELYFIICGFHPQFGYVDQPPIVPLLSAGTQIFGHSLFLLRLLPALCAAGGVYVTCRLVSELGGGAFAQVFAAVTVFLCPVLTNFGMKVSTDAIGLWSWPAIALLLVRLVKGGDARLWLGIGALAGISIESKYSVLFFLFALVVALLLVPQRRLLANRWCAAGLGLAVVLALPNFLWQWHYGFPMIELLRAGQNGKNEIAGPLLFLLQEVLITGFLLAVVWIIGLVWLLRSATYRFLGYAFILLIAVMIVLHGKHYYPANVYPIIIGAGAVPIESWTRGKRAFQGVALALAVLAGAFLLPMALPILPEQTFVRYATALNNVLHVNKATETEPGRDAGTLPGDWADMHGWPQMAATVKRVYDSLPPRERVRAVVFADNYGEASAVAFFEPGVPVISNHNQYWLWGTRGYDGNTLIHVNGSCGNTNVYRSSELAARLNDPWAISYEKNAPIRICRGLKVPIAQLWAKAKVYE